MSWLSKKLKKLGRAVDPTSSSSVVRKQLRNVDNAVGGAQGWAKVAGAAAAVVNVVPGVGQLASAGLATTAGGLAAAANKQKADKARREAQAAAVEQQKQQLAAAQPAAVLKRNAPTIALVGVGLVVLYIVARRA